MPVQLTVASRTVASGLFVRLSMGRQQPADTFVIRWKLGQGKVQVVLHACCSAVSALRDTAPAAPMGHGMSCGGSNYWSNSISPTQLSGNRAVPQSAAVCCGWRHSYSWSGFRRGFPWVGVWWTQGRDCKGPLRHAGLPPSLLFSTLYSQCPGLGWDNIQELTMQGMTFKEKKQILNTT